MNEQNEAVGFALAPQDFNLTVGKVGEYIAAVKFANANRFDGMKLDEVVEVLRGEFPDITRAVARQAIIQQNGRMVAGGVVRFNRNRAIMFGAATGAGQ